MNSWRWHSAVALAVTIFAAPIGLRAQPAPPRIGYVYPAGGRTGTTVQIVVGGQFLSGATNVYFSGTGLRGVVVDYNRPMPQGQFNQLRDELRELQDKRAAALKARRKGGDSKSTNTWTAADEKRATEIRAKILKNPPNRNAAPAIAEVVTIKLTLAADAEIGAREIRVATPNGLSNPLRFWVGKLPELSAPPAKADNPDLKRFLQARFGTQPKDESARSEMRVTLPAVVNGQITPGAVDRIRFAARQGQKLVVAVSARELIPYLADAVPGWFQAAVTLRDGKGKELAYDDDFRFHPDPVLAYTIPRDGDYVVEINDALFRGREDFVYRVTMGELPFITGVFPLGGRSGATAAVELRGWNLPVTNLTLDSQSPGVMTQPVSVHQGEFVSNIVPFVRDDLPECVEREPNDSIEAAQRVALPILINGRVDRPGDTDVFAFEGKSGDEVIAEVVARRLDAPLDSVLRLTDAGGRQLAFNDDSEDKGSGLNTHHADSRLSARLPTAGTYFVHLGDTQHQGGPDYAYRLRLGAPRPDFALRVVPSSINARAGATVPVTVFALRKDGFSNAIALALADPPEGFALSGARVPANADRVRLTLTVPATIGAEPVSLSLEGRARIDSREVRHPALPADDMMQAFAYHHLVPAQELRVALAGRGNLRNSLRILSGSPVRIPVGGTARVRVGPLRPAFADRIRLELSEPPEGITLKSVSPVRDGLELTLQCDAAKTKPGLEGNLIVDILAGPSLLPARARNQPAARHIALGALPAIPFELVAGR